MPPTKEPQKPAVQYTVIVRLPFPRGDFVAPPQVEWDVAKDKKLWKLIARNPKSASASSSGSSEVDWPARAAEFGVDTPFLLQQAAWLYERHFKAVKAQMTRIRASSTVASPVVPGLPGTSGMGKRGPGPGSRAPSALSIRSRDSPVPTSIPGTPRLANAPSLSRNPSTATVTQSRHFAPPASPRHRNVREGTSRKSDTAPVADQAGRPSVPVSSSPASSSESSTSSSESAPDTSRSHAFRRPPRFGVKRGPSLSHVSDEAEEDDDEPRFLPYGQTPTEPALVSPHGNQDPSDTLKNNKLGSKSGADRTEDKPGKGSKADAEGLPDSSNRKGKGRAVRAESSTGSLGSTGAQQHPQTHQARGISALSPRRRAELVGSPRRTGTGGTENSDETPSMGSSFSDLDDASITQSALEEALASNLRHGGASRLSNLGHAFRSRYMQ